MPEKRGPEKGGLFAGSVSMHDVLLTPERVEDHNRKLQKFFVAFENAARNIFEQRSRTFQFQIVAANSGSAPAEDFAVHLHFPDGFVLRTGEEWTALQSKLPRPPDTPTSVFERGIAGIGNHLMRPIAEQRGISLAKSADGESVDSREVRRECRAFRPGLTRHSLAEEVAATVRRSNQPISTPWKIR